MKSKILAVAILLSIGSSANANPMADLLSEDLDCVAKKGQEDRHWAYAFRIIDSKPTFCEYRVGNGYGPLDTPEMLKFCAPIDQVNENKFNTIKSRGDAGHIVTLVDVVSGRTAMAELPANVKRYFAVHRMYGLGTGDVDLYCYSANH